jgi:uncharacterized protein (TIGR00369 family)
VENGLVQLEKEMKQLNEGRETKLAVPPSCFTAMRGEFLEYDHRKSLKVAFPVLPESLNPQGSMQGGFVAAAFDNVFGPLSFVAARRPCTTLDLQIQFIRGIRSGDTLSICANVVSCGSRTIHMSGEAHDSHGKLIATGNTNLLILT